jgi:predicted HAD superfamily Cof-like phosphohydrolase
MKKSQQSVRLFMFKAGQSAPLRPTVPDSVTRALRLKLHLEEAVTELSEAFEKKDIVLIADSIADSLVVVLGTAVACGIDIEPIFDEIMRSNMTKFIDGHRREDGKWVKGPSYTPANIAPLIQDQIRL